MQFTVRFSKDVKMITWVSVIILGVVISDIPLLAYFGVPTTVMLPAVGVPILAVVVVLYCVLRFQVKGYTLDLDGLSIQRRWDRVNFPLDGIEAVEGGDDFRKSIRVWGVGGIMGHYGKFKKIGGSMFTAYITDSQNCICIKTTEGRIVISPHERELFLETLATLRPDLPIRENRPYGRSGE